MMTVNHSCLPVEVRTVVYRRALAQGYLNACKSLGITVSATLDELQMTIALELEGFYVRRHGPDAGMEMACTMLGDMVEPDLLTAPPRLTQLGVTMMDELFRSQLAAASRAPRCTEGEHADEKYCL
ncbi:DUF5375 family protein [Chimaeribacter arupi]|uniref:DUF5375 family protein n=1 Tax=Chimaeribacter arupi TaxID=2060066 RepID=UPI002711DC85|nr:DUF5375 family protein [Chimaeribacter arupi]WKZ93225.1 DUF5375 family protein [Chimaeribacter arupi]